MCYHYRREMLIPCCDSALQNASLYKPPKFKVLYINILQLLRVLHFLVILYHYPELLTCNSVCIPQIERARWLWDKQSKEEAMTLLGSYLSEMEKSPDSITSRGRAEAKLLYANWRELTSYYDSEDIQHLFLKVLILCFITLKSLQ